VDTWNGGLKSNERTFELLVLLSAMLECEIFSLILQHDIMGFTVKFYDK